MLAATARPITTFATIIYLIAAPLGDLFQIHLVLLSRKTPVSFRNSACPDAMVVW
jgi:hypothetical protein